MTEVALGTPTDDEWPAILRVANEALPNAPDGNIGWFENRRGFDEGSRTRRHYVAERDGEIVAYGAVEDTDDPARWRLFVVMSPEQLNGGLGDLMLEQLVRDTEELGGSAIWMREQADDGAILSFAMARGFIETRRFAVDDGGAYQGVEVVELERGMNGEI